MNHHNYTNKNSVFPKLQLFSSCSPQQNKSPNEQRCG